MQEREGGDTHDMSADTSRSSVAEATISKSMRHPADTRLGKRVECRRHQAVLCLPVCACTAVRCMVRRATLWDPINSTMLPSQRVVKAVGEQNHALLTRS